MNAIWRTIRGYILWQYERGTLHYDIMVTLILIFIFFSPRVINFNDKPVARNPHPTEVVVTSDTEGRLIYQVTASAVTLLERGGQDGALPVDFHRRQHRASSDGRAHLR